MSVHTPWSPPARPLPYRDRNWMTLIGRDFWSGFLDLGEPLSRTSRALVGRWVAQQPNRGINLADVAVTECFGRVQVRYRDHCAEKWLKGPTARAKPSCDDATLSMWPDLVSLFRRRKFAALAITDILVLPPTPAGRPSRCPLSREPRRTARAARPASEAVVDPADEPLDIEIDGAGRAAR
jgi:hypothetical protein